MSPRIFIISLIGAIVLVAVAAGAWYLFWAPDEEPLARGAIEGTTLYPSDFVPAQRVCAQLITKPSTTHCTDVPESSDGVVPAFHIAVPPGQYYVYAELKDASDISADLSGYKAYYTQFVICGLEYACKDHTKLSVDVAAGQTVSNIRPHDWYE